MSKQPSKPAHKPFYAFIGSFYDEKRSPYVWAAVLAGLCVFAWLLQKELSGDLFLLWTKVKPKFVYRWMLGTPFDWAVLRLNIFFSLDLPHCLVLFPTSWTIGAVFFKHWLKLTLFFGIVYNVIWVAHGVSRLTDVIEFLQAGNYGLAALYAGFFALTLLPLAAGAWLGARWRLRRVRTAGQCKYCGYDLTGNTSGICPECGTPVAEDVRNQQNKS